MLFSLHHSNSHERLRRAIRWNWIRRGRERWSRSASHSARQPVHRVSASRNVHAWRRSSTRELKLKIHAIEVHDLSDVDKGFFTQLFPPTTGSSTLPRPTTKATEADLIRSDKPATNASTTSLYDNVSSGNQGQGQQGEASTSPNLLVDDSCWHFRLLF